MPVDEKPPAMPGDIYSFPKNSYKSFTFSFFYYIIKVYELIDKGEKIYG